MDDQLRTSPLKLDSKNLAGGSQKEKLEQLKSHPLFGDLQVTLAMDCMNSNIPFSLLGEVSPTNSEKPDGNTGFSTVSEQILKQHMKLQTTLVGLRPQFPSLLAVYTQVTEQVESQRYRALAFNCYSEHCKQLINCFYDNERQLLIERIQETVNMLLLSGQSLLHDMINLQTQGINPLTERLIPKPLLSTSANSTPFRLKPEHPETGPLDLRNLPPPSSAGPSKDSTGAPVKKSRFLSKRAVAILQRWYREHRDHPYATDDEVKELAAAGEITPNQVKKWMANTRARSYNTLTYNGGKHGFAGRAAMKRKYFSKFGMDNLKSTNQTLLTRASVADLHPETNLNKPQTPVSVSDNEEEINVTAMDTPTPDLPSHTENSEKATFPSSKTSLEQVVERCRAKTIEQSAPEADHPEKSAIDNLKEVVNNVSDKNSDKEESDAYNRMFDSAQSSSSPDSSSSESYSSCKRYLGSHAKAILNDWFRKHVYRPYPTYNEKKELAQLCGISPTKVDTWFANKRNRTNNTRKLPPKYSQLLNMPVSMST